MWYSIYLALGAFLFALLGTRHVTLALRKKPLLLDIPNVRSNHRVATPRGGGIAVVIALLIFLLAVDATYTLIFALIFVAAISLLDDWIGVPPPARLLVQLFAIILVLAQSQFTLFADWLPAWCDRAIIVLLWLWFTNLFNFMDGIDGLAASEMICTSAGICLVAAFADSFGSPLSLYALIVFAAGSGFLWWNWHPAKIFLGDVGSITIGFLLGYLLFLAVQEGYLYAALILPAYFLMDSTVTLARRILAGKKPWQAHSEHFYQQAVRGGKTHDAVVRYVFGINILLIFLSVFSAVEPDLAWLDLLIAYAMVTLLLFFFARLGKKTPLAGEAA